MTMTKREANRLERRAAIIAVARAHFFEHGYAATTMSDIAAKLGGSKGTLWSYFPSKEDLFSAVVEDTAAGLQGQLEFPEPGDDPLETLNILCRSLLERALSPVALSMFRLLNQEGARFPEVARIFNERGPTITRRMVGEYLRHNFARHMRDIDDYIVAGQVLVSLCTSGSYFDRLWGLVGPVPKKQREIEAARAAELFLRAYGNDKALRLLHDKERSDSDIARRKLAKTA